MPDSITVITLAINIFTLLVLILTLLVVFWQSRLILRTIEASTFVQLLQRAEDIHLSETLDMISQWQFVNYDNYTKAGNVTDQQRARVRQLIDFFNDLTHLARNKYVNDLYPARLYAVSLLTCREKLLPWWLDGIRKSRHQPLMYRNFQAACDWAQYWDMNGRDNCHVGFHKYMTEIWKPPVQELTT